VIGYLNMFWRKASGERKQNINILPAGISISIAIDYIPPEVRASSI
jgi:hypothetical protein